MAGEQMQEETDRRKVHQLVLVHGRERAREMMPERQKSLVDIAAAVMADETQSIGITYTGFCLTALPHKKLPNDRAWTKEGHRVTLMVEPGRMMVDKKTQLFGVPYGARARMILLYLQSQAVRTTSREVELGRSMSDWMSRMGIVWGGETARAIRDQAARISACSLKFFWQGEQTEGWAAGRIVNSGLRFSAAMNRDGQGALWEDRVVLDENFFNALKEHPVPVLDAAIRELRERSMSLDIYIWLAWRLQHISADTPISWTAIHQQFGSGYAKLFHFKPGFVQSLAAALAAYPDAQVEVGEAGITLRPSPPPVAPRISGRHLAIG